MWQQEFGLVEARHNRSIIQQRSWHCRCPETCFWECRFWITTIWI